MPISGSLKSVLDILNLEQLETNLYRGESEDHGIGAIFGGQVLGQALVAAARTLDKDDQQRNAHSLHAYFLRPGHRKSPVVYDVDRIRDGRSFNTRRVRAIQHGRAIFNMSVSFQAEEEGYEHQMPAPPFPSPEGLKDEVDLRHERADELPEHLKERSLRDRPFFMRPVHQQDYMTPRQSDPESQMWLCARGDLDEYQLDGVQPQLMHQALIAYASDMGLMSTCLLPHEVNYLTPGFQGASLDHAMWFHRPFRADEWLMYATDSPVSGGARGFNRGSMYRQDGTLVVSAAQEALIRLWQKPKEPGRVPR